MSEIPSVEEIAGRFARLQEQVRGAEAAAGRSQESVQIELAAKYQAPERVLAALQAGSTLLGHNIIQQLEASETALAAAAAPAHRTSRSSRCTSAPLPHRQTATSRTRLAG